MGSQKDAGSTGGVSVSTRVGFGLSLTVGTLGVCALSLPHLPFFSSVRLVCLFRGLSLFCPFGLPGRRSRRHSGEGGSGETRARLREEVLPTGLGLDHFVPCAIL